MGGGGRTEREPTPTYPPTHPHTHTYTHTHTYFLLHTVIVPPLLFFWCLMRYNRVGYLEVITFFAYHFMRLGPKYRFFAHHHTLIHKEGHSAKGIFRWSSRNLPPPMTCVCSKIHTDIHIHICIHICIHTLIKSYIMCGIF